MIVCAGGRIEPRPRASDWDSPPEGNELRRLPVQGILELALVLIVRLELLLRKGARRQG